MEESVSVLAGGAEAGGPARLDDPHDLLAALLAPLPPPLVDAAAPPAPVVVARPADGAHRLDKPPDDLIDLELELDWSIDQTKGRADLLWSFFHAAELEL